MSVAFFQGAEIAMSSGASATAYAKIDRVQDIKIDYQIPRVQTSVIGRVKPLNDQPVINYTPVSLSVNYTKGNKDVERNLGILNTTGVAVQIGQGSTVPDWGARSFQIYNAPNTIIPTYAGQWDVVTGILKSWSLAGSVGDAVRGTFSLEALDLRQVPNNAARTIPSYSGQLIKPENVTITGIDFTGLGYSGLLIQSFSFQLGFEHAQTFNLGSKYPERRMTAASATLQLSAFIDNGVSNQATSLTGYDVGSAMNGAYILNLQPSCGGEAPTIITMTAPYLMNQSIGIQVGNFTAIDLTFGCPLSFVPFEATGAGMGSNVTIT